MTLHAQFLTMGLMFGCGLALGILFDTYRVLTGQLKAPRWLIPLFDLVYWAGATGFVFRALFYSNQGQVRLFVFIGLIAGFSFHFCFTSPMTIRAVLGLIRFVKWLWRMLVRTVDLLVITPVLALYKFILVLLGFLWALTIFLAKIVLQLIYPFWRVLRFFGRLFGRWIPIQALSGWLMDRVVRPALRPVAWFRRWLRK